MGLSRPLEIARFDPARQKIAWSGLIKFVIFGQRWQWSRKKQNKEIRNDSRGFIVLQT